LALQLFLLDHEHGFRLSAQPELTDFATIALLAPNLNLMVKRQKFVSFNQIKLKDLLALSMVAFGMIEMIRKKLNLTLATMLQEITLSNEP
jgi:hypothetical protein